MSVAAEARVASVDELMRRRAIDAVLLTSIPNVAYVTGYSPPWEMWPGYNPLAPDPAICCIDQDGRARLIVPELHAPYAEGSKAPVDLVATTSHLRSIAPTAMCADAIARCLGRSVARLGYDAHGLSLALQHAVAERIEVSAWIDVEPDLDELRMIKSDAEVAAIRRACELADVMQATVKACAEPGITELELTARALEASWAHAGGRHAALLQLATGPITATIPSGEPSDKKVEEGELICTDVAPWLGGYWSDTCNGVVAGKPSAQQEEMFAIVQAALDVAVRSARAGIEARELDRLCRSVVNEAGYDYPHHTGHGIGTAHTEAPRITKDSRATLAAGMVICIEPGIYVDGVGGFRHEHVLLVTSAEPQVLTTYRHTL